MTRPTRVVRSVRALRATIGSLRRGGRTIALVPTMGALHDGHISLIRLAKRRADRVVVSIFVNPAQFGPSEDFSSYPRTFDSDLEAISQLKADLVWAPMVAAMYPEGFAIKVDLSGPAKAGLEDAFRPHFFSGVATVVAKLFIQVAPDFAIFGQKDYQQLMVVTRMARDLDLPLKVIGAPTIREKDGLAMSSRNVYLSAAERAAAPALYRALRTSADRIAAGDAIAPLMEQGRREIADAGFQVDYFEARHAETLAPVASAAEGPIRLLAAARIGKTRLIDNVAVRSRR
jgi:pantoate--beta-alanine ligase